MSANRPTRSTRTNTNYNLAALSKQNMYDYEEEDDVRSRNSDRGKARSRRGNTSSSRASSTKRRSARKATTADSEDDDGSSSSLSSVIDDDDDDLESNVSNSRNQNGKQEDGLDEEHIEMFDFSNEESIEKLPDTFALYVFIQKYMKSVSCTPKELEDALSLSEPSDLLKKIAIRGLKSINYSLKREKPNNDNWQTFLSKCIDNRFRRKDIFLFDANPLVRLDGETVESNDEHQKKNENTVSKSTDPENEAGESAKEHANTHTEKTVDQSDDNTKKFNTKETTLNGLDDDVSQNGSSKQENGLDDEKGDDDDDGTENGGEDFAIDFFELSPKMKLSILKELTDWVLLDSREIKNTMETYDRRQDLLDSELVGLNADGCKIYHYGMDNARFYLEKKNGEWNIASSTIEEMKDFLEQMRNSQDASVEWSRHTKKSVSSCIKRFSELAEKVEESIAALEKARQEEANRKALEERRALQLQQLLIDGPRRSSRKRVQRYDPSDFEDETRRKRKRKLSDYSENTPEPSRPAPMRASRRLNKDLSESQFEELEVRLVEQRVKEEEEKLRRKRHEQGIYSEEEEEAEEDEIKIDDEQQEEEKADVPKIKIRLGVTSTTESKSPVEESVVKAWSYAVAEDAAYSKHKKVAQRPLQPGAPSMPVLPHAVPAKVVHGPPQIPPRPKLPSPNMDHSQGYSLPAPSASSYSARPHFPHPPTSNVPYSGPSAFRPHNSPHRPHNLPRPVVPHRPLPYQQNQPVFPPPVIYQHDQQYNYRPPTNKEALPQYREPHGARPSLRPEQQYGVYRPMSKPPNAANETVYQPQHPPPRPHHKMMIQENGGQEPLPYFSHSSTTNNQQ